MSFKVLMAGRRRRGQTLAEHRHHMKDVHGRLVLDYIAAEPDNAPRRYVQNHVFDGIFPGGEGKPEPFVRGVDFVTEIWVPDLASLKASRETPFYQTHLLPDEPRMVDPEQVVGIPVNEEIVRAPDETGASRVKVFVFWHATAPAIPALIAALGVTADAALGHSRCTPAVPSPVKAIDIFALADAAAGIGFAQACRDAIRDRLPAEHDNFSIAIANEHVLNAG
ncbi:EthD domain-containing protein [Rhizobium sp. C4]|uniref:EthD domain-containing protein n=1 Tax=Rhizobium sp. C4 TaxID=1349800 RepID=UPI001E5C7AC8|nr:EthD domain-containing protein [Rhizobium sp. C4]MCD2172369.1 EthD domain-containing protein [Rhizobium sp. C4]